MPSGWAPSLAPDPSLRLHCLAAQPDGPAALALLAAAPSAAAEAQVEDPVTGALPLHLACAHGAPHALVSALLAAHSAGVRARSAGGRLPLHWACVAGAAAGEGDALATAGSLLDAAPDAASSPDCTGALPLHYAACGAPLGVCRALLAAHRRGAAEADAFGRLPLHAAAAAGAAGTQALQLLVEVHSQARVPASEGGAGDRRGEKGDSGC